MTWTGFMTLSQRKQRSQSRLKSAVFLSLKESLTLTCQTRKNIARKAVRGHVSVRDSFSLNSTADLSLDCERCFRWLNGMNPVHVKSQRISEGATLPPRDKVVILGDGNAKAVFNYEGDIGTYTIKAVDEPRTLNKILYIRPPKNIYSFNKVVPLWEKLIGKTLEKTYVPEDQLLKQIQEAPIPLNELLAISHSAFVKGDQTNFVIESSFGVEASELYPDVKYTIVEECLSRFV
ncbi:hypothetical protein CRYUN_Cryun27aG0097300 [Craigia yunnanensis]